MGYITKRIRCENDLELMAVLKALDKMGVVWNSRKPIMEYKPPTPTSISLWDDDTVTHGEDRRSTDISAKDFVGNDLVAKVIEDAMSDVRGVKTNLGRYIGALNEIKSQLKSNGQIEFDKAYQNGLEAGKKYATEQIGSNEQAIADKAYQSGLEEAWAAAKKIFAMDDITAEQSGLDDIDNMTASEAIAELKKYEEQQKAKIDFCEGDEIISCNGDKGIVVAVGENGYTVTWHDDPRKTQANRHSFSKDWMQKWFTKTGKTYPAVVEALKELRTIKMEF